MFLFDNFYLRVAPGLPWSLPGVPKDPSRVPNMTMLAGKGVLMRQFAFDITCYYVIVDVICSSTRARGPYYDVGWEVLFDGAICL